MIYNNRKLKLVVCYLFTLFFFTGCIRLSGEKKLSFYHYDLANKELYEELGKEYSKDSAYNIEVKAVPRETYFSNLREAQELPDVFLLAEEDLPEVIEDKKMSKKFSNLKQFSEKEEIVNFFPRVAREKGWFRETTLALPYKYDIPVILYNKDLFELYNLEEPENIEDFIETCSSLAENNIIPIGIKTKEDLLDIGYLAQGVLLNSEDGSDLIIEEGELSSGFEDLFELSSNFQGGKFLKNDPPNNNEELLQGFANEEYAMFSGTLEDIEYLDNADINYGYFTMPGYLGNSRGVIKVSSVIAISEKAKSSKEARNFVLFLLHDENQNKLGVRADGFTIYPRQENKSTSPEEVYSFAEELNLGPSLFQNRPAEEREIYLKEVNRMFFNEFKNYDEFAEKLKSQLQ